MSLLRQTLCPLLLRALRPGIATLRLSLLLSDALLGLTRWTGAVCLPRLSGLCLALPLRQRLTLAALFRCYRTLASLRLSPLRSALLRPG